MAAMLPRSSTGPPGFPWSRTDNPNPRYTTDQDSKISITRTQSESQGNFSKLYSADAIPEFDEYGAELGKEAKVWKVYVNETDRWDAELVDGWNKSLDVILVFAALFSAISTTFLIESSSRLRADPTDTSTETLLIISRTLLAISNNTRAPDLDNPFNVNPEGTTFKPSNSAIIINAMWYLSLSLSVATSFLAMLAKDWCHSFMAGRNGHPCVQARRRQQKWNMIKHWKMREIIRILPSLIHLSLFLFAIGLCIDVWETNIGVAIPVIGITGLAVVFYAWSSLTAIWVHDFPYTTIISKVFRSKPAMVIARWAFGWTLLPVVNRLSSFIRWWDEENDRIPLLDAPLDYLIRLFRQWQYRLRSFVGLDAPCLMQKENPEQDIITSSALGWLIEHCEVPRSVEIALQAIAGASVRLPPEPLKKCKAALQISRRLVSGHLYKKTESGYENPAISLYVRALSFMNSTPQDNLQPNSDADTRKMDVMVWDLQFENENRVAELIIEGHFEPDDRHLEALRIGGTAASLSLRLLDDGRDARAAPDFKRIIELLQQHVERRSGEHGLHRAACLSLVNAAILFSACSTGTKASGILAGSRGVSSSDRRWARIDQALIGVPQYLRSLGSFTSLPMRPNPNPERLTDREMTSTPKHHTIRMEETLEELVRDDEKAMID
ncbi:unnamed protein product [Rhizoctonia solani]|uniref:DUF6535 domain-containing protein n=1 Tax=Rhizoctonia solani TaxID=456999 RepID=A0A8H3AED2_9AGAM|nr:unnamed protein product [Rhizoctonia solani]